MNKEFLSVLKQMYGQIDKNSNLLWSHKDGSQFIHSKGSKNTRSRLTDEKKEESTQWEKDTDAQFGYGEITKGALQHLLSKIQRCTELLLTEEQLNRLPFPKEDYNLKENSTFLDIGSGFGKPVFHASLQTYCHSKGIEVVPARVIFSLDQKFQFIEARDKK